MKLRLSDQPVAYSVALRAILAMLVVLNVVNLTDVQIAASVLALESVLGVFVWQSVTPTSQVAEQVDTARKQGEDAAVAVIAAAAPPKKTATKRAPARKR